MTTDLTVTGLTGVPSVAIRVKSWPSMENWIPHTVHKPPTRRSLNLFPRSTQTSLYGTGDPVGWPGASCDVITESWLILQRYRHGNRRKTQRRCEHSRGLTSHFRPRGGLFMTENIYGFPNTHKHILECCLNTHRSLLLSCPLQSVIILPNNTATCKNCPSAGCVSAAYHVRKDLAIFRKLSTSLKKIVRWFVTFLYKLICVFLGFRNFAPTIFIFASLLYCFVRLLFWFCAFVLLFLSCVWLLAL
jgi:hypothetical protein